MVLREGASKMLTARVLKTILRKAPPALDKIYFRVGYISRRVLVMRLELVFVLGY